MGNKSAQNMIKTTVMIRAASWRRLRAARHILRRNRRKMSENQILIELLTAYFTEWNGEAPCTNGARRYNIRGCGYVRRGLYLSRKLYRATWQRGSHSGESVSQMIDYAIRYYLPVMLGKFLNVLPKSPNETVNSEYWRRRWFLRKILLRPIFYNYTESSVVSKEFTHSWTQNLQIENNFEEELAPWDLRSPFAYLYHSENAIYTPPHI